MEYYFISFFISLIIFIIIQFIEYSKHLNEIKNNSDNYFIEPYTPFKLNNLFIFIIIYIVFTIACYYLNFSNFNFIYSSFLNSNNSQTNSQSNKKDIDPKILSKINDNFKVGIEPFNSDTENKSPLNSSDDDNNENETTDDDETEEESE